MQTHGGLCCGSAVQPLLEKRLKPVSLGSQIRGSRIQFADAQKDTWQDNLALKPWTLVLEVPKALPKDSDSAKQRRSCKGTMHAEALNESLPCLASTFSATKGRVFAAVLPESASSGDVRTDIQQVGDLCS